MIKKSTWIVLGVLAVVIVAFLLIQSNTAEEETPELPTPTFQPTLLALDDQAIQTITYRQIDLEEIKLERVATLEWEVTSHPESLITAGKVEELLSYLSDLRIISTLPDPPPLEDIGLQEPVRAFIIEFENGDSYTIEIGIQTPLNNGYYARVDDGEIIIIPLMNVDQAVNVMINASIPPTPTPDPEATTPLPDDEITPTVEDSTITPEEEPTVTPTAEIEDEG
jgi:hypothetical protein